MTHECIVYGKYLVVRQSAACVVFGSYRSNFESFDHFMALRRVGEERKAMEAKSSQSPLEETGPRVGRYIRDTLSFCLF